MSSEGLPESDFKSPIWLTIDFGLFSAEQQNPSMSKFHSTTAIMARDWCDFIRFADLQMLVSMTPYSSDKERWIAVQTRDANADGSFVYAVATTRIYCRPVCRARLARRANVHFFAHPQDAERAGYRACKRCKPDDAGTMPGDGGVEKVRLFIQHLDAQLASTNAATRAGGPRTPTLGEMAAQSGLSKWHFHRIFKSLTGVTPAQYVGRDRSSHTAGIIIGTTAEDVQGNHSLASLAGPGTLATAQLGDIPATTIADYDAIFGLDVTQAGPQPNLLGNVDLDLYDLGMFFE